MTHRASSESWGNESGARICQLVMQDNNGIAQSIAENRIDLLELLTLEELNQADDLGLTPIYLAVLYDQPEVLLYLYNRGVNINNFCDPMEWGTPLYYAVTLHRHRLLEVFDQMGINFNDPCDNLGQNAITHARRINDKYSEDLIENLMTRTYRAGMLVLTRLRTLVVKNKYLRIKRAAANINRVLRGRRGRKRYRTIKSDPRLYWDTLEGKIEGEDKDQEDDEEED